LNQIIFDRVCSFCDKKIYPALTNDNVWEASEFVIQHFDLEEVNNQIDYLLDQYLANKR